MLLRISRVAVGVDVIDSLREVDTSPPDIVDTSLTRGLDRERDLDLRRLGVLELELGLVGVVAGEPVRKRFFISSMASSVGLAIGLLILERGLLTGFMAGLSLSYPALLVRAYMRLASGESASSSGSGLFRRV